MNRTAIVVDDSAMITRVMSDLLETRGINVLATAFDGEQAIQVYKKHKPDFVFLDVIMPRYDGIYALKGIRKINPKANVIMVTGDERPETTKTLTELKACAIVYKPFDIDEMMKTIEKVSLQN